MAQFNQQPIIEEGLADMLTDQEKHERIKKALEIHMLQNREAHMKPQETIMSFTQGDPNAVVGSAHGMTEEKKEKSLEQKQAEEQQLWNQSSSKQKALPVRTCPCCVNFLKNFGLSDKDVAKYTSGLDGGPVGYQGGSSGGSEYSGSSGGYSGSSGGTSYSGAGGADYSSGGPKY
jgi:hypothetical protein